MVRAVDSDSFQPKIAFKSRYGIVANPFAENAEASTGYVASMLNTANHLGAHSNKYYRKVRLANLM